MYFEMSTVVVGAEALAMKLAMKLLRVLREIEIPATRPLSGSITLAFATSVDANSVCENPGLDEM